MPSAADLNGGASREVRRLYSLQERINAKLRRLVVKIAPDLERVPLETDASGTTHQTIAEIEREGYIYFLTRVQVLARRTLSLREKEIAVFVAHGLSNKRIARQLGISPSTVASHLRRIFSKLNIPSRVSLARWELPLS